MICRSLITINELWNQYPNAWNLIYSLPAVCRSSQCFKPEAELLIQKFLSLKGENALKFIDNVEEHSRAKRKVSIIFKLRTTKYSLSTLKHFFLSGPVSNSNCVYNPARSHFFEVVGSSLVQSTVGGRLTHTDDKSITPYESCVR
ncbi:hypothetical protein BYT27DRAFT_6399850 [Phlegmacium glaucopus]|nr:hypothetical protein BYT27DRAFT_6399850 [Phlegmacium glaucopus]